MSDLDQPVVTPLGTTAGGLPVPADTDLVMAGAQAITALAQALDARPRLRARKAGQYNIAGSGADVVQGQARRCGMCSRLTTTIRATLWVWWRP